MKWLFNPLMIAGAVLGWFIWSAAAQLEEVVYHEGDGWVSRGEEDSELVPESQYKRQRLGEGAFMLAMGLGIWAAVARAANSRARALDKDNPHGVRCGGRVYTSEEWEAVVRQLEEFRGGGRRPEGPECPGE
jgi:hypothetical protein